MKVLKAISFKSLKGEVIVKVTNGNELTPSCGSYGAYTLIILGGRELVIWNSMGEVNLSEVVEK